MALVHSIGFKVIGISVDNASANRKFFKEFLCNGCLTDCVQNPLNGEKIYLFFDPTHIIKNIYNNFLTRKKFELPSWSSVVPNAITAKFSDIETVYEKECQMPLRIAHRLTETVLNPKSIEKVNVKLALAIFHESTVHALKHYGFNETAAFLELILKLWSILNVSNPELGKRKRNVICDPVTSPSDWKLEFLLNFGECIGFWEQSSVSKS